MWSGPKSSVRLYLNVFKGVALFVINVRSPLPCCDKDVSLPWYTEYSMQIEPKPSQFKLPYQSIRSGWLKKTPKNSATGTHFNYSVDFSSASVTTTKPSLMN